MRKSVVVFLMIVLVAGIALANGNSERLAEIEGTIVGMAQEGERARVTLRTAEGEEVVVEVPAAEVERLRLRIEARVSVEGDYIGVPLARKSQMRARILAKAVKVGDERIAVGEPLELSAQDREQIREYEREQAKSQTRDGTRSQDKSRDKTQSKSGN